MIQSILLIILSVIATSFAFLYYDQKKKNVLVLAQTLEFLMLQEEQQEQSKTEKDQVNEDFLKFISDSRDVAYTYIEDMQLSLNKFINDIEPEINYFKEYGDIGSMSPNYYSMKKIVGSYEELKKILPEDEVKED
jgi:type II secretory pathway pseudopilin PulG